MKKEPHSSHKMSEWEDTIVTITCTPRFGRIRSCEDCGGEQAETSAGKAIHPELLDCCVFSDDYKSPATEIAELKAEVKQLKEYVQSCELMIECLSRNRKSMTKCLDQTLPFICTDCGNHQNNMTSCTHCGSKRTVYVSVVKTFFGDDYMDNFDDEEENQ